MSDKIIIKNAQEHNLKGVSLDIPRDSLVVVTGVSGSGKSSLAFDTIFQEGQRKYIESLSAYARQFIGAMKSPNVETIQGVSPTISIDQKTINRNPRSTVGTVTEILDHFRLLYARLGEAECPECGKEIKAQTVEQIVNALLSDYNGAKLTIMAPIVQERKGEYRKEFRELKEKGFVRVRVDGKMRRLDEEIVLERYEKHTIEVVVDRVRIENKVISRMQEAVEQVLKLSSPVVSFLIQNKSKEIYLVQSTDMGCASCRISFPEIEPRLFSFNVSQGECPACKGLGRSYKFVEDLVIPDKSLSVNDGAIKARQPAGNISFSKYGQYELELLANEYKFSLDTPWNKLTKKAQKVILYGSDKNIKHSVVKTGAKRWGGGQVKHYNKPIRGVMDVLQDVWERWHVSLLQKYMRESVCHECNGARINKFARAIKFRGHGINELSTWTVEDLEKFFSELQLSKREELIGKEIFKEINNRLGFLKLVGLTYLNLDRGAGTLSGGEAQRIRLAAQVGAGLQGVLYVLDEPSIGLHPKDNERLLDTLETLRDNGNSLIVVEHDEDTMRRADCIIDIGPGAGVKGGEILAQGKWNSLLKNPKSLTGAYLSNTKRIEIPKKRRKIGEEKLIIKGARHNNLKNIDVELPLGVMVAITGASGSGKSSLINGILKKVLSREFHGALAEPGDYDEVLGMEYIDKVIEIDQSPIGRTPRSNPATYTKVFDLIRDLFAALPESKLRGYKKGRFSFNVKGGRCEQCEGAGSQEVDMQILSNVQVQCDSCDGKRFNDATLEIHFKGKTIADVLDLTVNQACEFFADQPKIYNILNVLRDIGLGYIRLGQASTTLSGGEAQRMKLASELRRASTGKTLYLLDEPTTGLHFEDIKRLLSCLNELVEQNNSVVVIEHNLDVVKCADWVVDLGPEGGVGGGEIVACGTPEKIAKTKKSYTGLFLKPVLKHQHLGSMVKPKKAKKKLTHNIEVIGATKHNLKNINVKIPQHKITTISGVSGSGKSSLAFHTLFAEGQRRFVESLSTYARRFIGNMDRGQVEAINGLAPAIAIDQNASNKSPRSTVATVTEIYDYFRIMYSRLGEVHCPETGIKAIRHSVSDIYKEISGQYKNQMITLMAPLYLEKIPKNFLIKDPHHIHNMISMIKEWGYNRVCIDNEIMKIDEIPEKVNCQELYLIIDRPKVTPSNRQRVIESLEKSYEIGKDILAVYDMSEKTIKQYSYFPAVLESGYVLEKELDSKNFSFNSHWGACPTCEGLGKLYNRVCPECLGQKLKPEYNAVHINGINISDLCEFTVEENLEFFNHLKFSKSQSIAGVAQNKENATAVATPLLREIKGRLKFLMSVGLNYLQLNRTSDTLSGGEAQRIRLASQIGSGLEGVLYVLDEPTIGLHQRDTAQLIKTLNRLRDLGNTVVVVEHDLEMLEASDHIIDMGPEAGEFGGEVVAYGSPAQMKRKYKTSLTGAYLSKKKQLETASVNRENRKNDEFIELSGVKYHNIKNISVKIPVGAMTAITGVSGSGKSTLIMDALLPLVSQKTGGEYGPAQAKGKLKLPADIDAVVLVDQSRISGTPRSTPATVAKLLEPIRTFFGKLPQAKIKGFDKSRFTYNGRTGRCKACEGRGYKHIEMHFLSDVWEECDVCHGQRYNQETLTVEYKGKNIADVLNMRIDEAMVFFKEHASIYRKLAVLSNVGLGYVRLGQGCNTLSGGEGQRLKLGVELGKSGQKRTLYLLDEPSTGLHLHDIQKLWNQMELLVDRGDTVVFIEHQMDMIKNSDWIIDLGPEGGNLGGELLYQGKTSEFKAKKYPENHTWNALNK